MRALPVFVARSTTSELAGVAVAFGDARSLVRLFGAYVRR